MYQPPSKSYEPEGSRFSTSGGVLSVSPDGRYLTFLATDAEGTDHLWLRPIDSRESTRLPGTREASQPFWSPDSKSIAFFAERSLRRIDISGGPVRTVCPLPDPPAALAGSWSPDGEILFGVNGRGLFKVKASGGSATPVTMAGESCRDCLWPAFLPDGRRFLFTIVSATPDRGIYVGSLDGVAAQRILDARSSAMYSETGYLLYASAGALVARRFEAVRHQVHGDVVPVADRIWYNPGTHRAVFSVSHSGLLAYREPQVSRLQWISRTGTPLSSGPDGLYHSFTVSRNGHVLTSQLDPLQGTYDLWLYDPSWAAPARLTFDSASDLRPLWSTDEGGVLARRTGRVATLRSEGRQARHRTSSAPPAIPACGRCGLLGRRGSQVLGVQAFRTCASLDRAARPSRSSRVGRRRQIARKGGECVSRRELGGVHHGRGGLQGPQ
jgi:hypothetical protein